MKYEFYYPSRTGVAMVCITQRLMSDRRFECYTKDKRALIVAQRTCDDEDLTMSPT